jgi:hypothetical protein
MVISTPQRQQLTENTEYKKFIAKTVIDKAAWRFYDNALNERRRTENTPVKKTHEMALFYE